MTTKANDPGQPGVSTGSSSARGQGSWGALATVCLATFMVSIDFVAVTVSLPQVGAGTGASFEQLQWALEGPLVAVAALVLMAGYIADSAGRRPTFLWGLIVSGCGALVSSLAMKPYVLVGGRVLEGIGISMLLATGSVMLTEIFAVNGSRLPLATWWTFTGLSVAASPLIGGVVTDKLGWRWLFDMEALVALVAFLLGLAFVREPALSLPHLSGTPEGTGRNRADWTGLVLWSAGIAVLVVGLVQTTAAAHLGTFTQSGAIPYLIAAFVLFAAFVVDQAVRRAPMLDLSLFRRRTFTGSSIAAFGLSFAVYGPLMFLVLYLSYVLGHSPLDIGTRLLLLTGVTVPFLLLNGLLDRYIPAKLLISGGLTLVAAGFWLMSRLTASALTWQHLAPGLVVAGVGLELVNPRLASAAAATVRSQMAAMATRTTTTFRQLGTALGVSVFGAVFANRLTGSIGKALAPRAPSPVAAGGEASKIANLVLQDRLTDAAKLASAGAPGNMAAVLRHSFSNALREILVVAAVVALGSAVCALVVRSRDISRNGRNEPAEIPGGEVEMTIDEAPRVNVAAPPPATDVAGDGRNGGNGGNEGNWGNGGNLANREEDDYEATMGRLFEPGVDTPPAGVPAIVLGEPPAPEPQVSEAVAESPAALLGLVPGTAPRLPAAAANDAVVRDAAGPGGAAAEEGATTSEQVIDLGTRRRLYGQVTAATGEPLPAAEITLVSPGGEEAAHGYSGEDGWFYWADVPEGTYTLVAVAPSYRASAAIVSVQNDDARADVSLLGLGAIAGVVRRAQDNAPVGAEVELLNRQGSPVIVARTGQGGDFVLLDILEGDYELVVRATDYGLRKVAVHVARGGTFVANVALQGIGNLYGAVLSAGGGWVPDVKVELHDGAGFTVAGTRTDSAGSYHFSGIPEGRYTVSVSSEGESTATGSVTVDIGAGQTVGADVTVRDGW